MDAIHHRRSINKFKNEEPSRDIINKILEAGTWAPNHHHTEPWKFFVIRGDSREKLGNIMAETLLEKIENTDSSESQVRLEVERKKPLRAPVIITVAVSPSNNINVIEIEEVAAVASATQNMLLAIHALGLGSILRTGESAYDKRINDFFGLKGAERIFGFIYLGYPDIPPPKQSRTSFTKKTKWFE